MGFLDQGSLDLNTVRRLIRDEVSQLVPAIPTGVLSLPDSAVPITIPAGSTAGQAIVWDASTAAWVASDSVNVALSVPDGSIGDAQLTDMSASKLTAGIIDASVIALQTAGSGVRVVLDIAGLKEFGSDGGTTVSIPSDGSPSTFGGQINATAIQVSSSATINGAAGILVEPNSRLHMVGGQGDPTTAPVVTSSYPAGTTLNFNVDGNAVTGSRVTQFTTTGGTTGAITGYYGTLDTFDGTTHRTWMVLWRQSTGAIVAGSSFLLASGAGAQSGWGSVQIGNEVYAFLTYNGSFAIVSIAKLTNTQDSFVAPATQPGSSSFGAGATNCIVIGSDGSNPYVFSRTSLTLTSAKVTVTTPTIPSMGAFTTANAGAVRFGTPGHANNLGDSGAPTNLYGATYDSVLGDWIVHYTWGNSGGSTVGVLRQAYTVTSGKPDVVVAKEEIFWPTTLYSPFGHGGLLFDGTDLVVAGGTASTNTNKIRGGTALTWDYTAGTTLNFAYTWEDTIGVLHTAGSPQTAKSFDSGITAAPLMRQVVVVTLPTLPSLVNQNWLYVLPGTSPATTTLKKQSATSHASTNTGQVITFLTYDAAGGNPGASTFTAGGTPSFISGDASSAATSWYLDSAGTARIPSRTTAQRVATVGDVAYNTSVGRFEGYDGTAYQTFSQNQKSIYQRLAEAGAADGLLAAAWDLGTDDMIGAVGKTPTANRLNLSAIWLPKGTIVKTPLFYNFAASTGITSAALFLASTDGNPAGMTLTILATKTTSPGFSNANQMGLVNYTASAIIPADGIYYLGQYMDANAAPGTMLGRTVNDGSATGLINMQTPAGYPRHITRTGALTNAQMAVGQTISATVPNAVPMVTTSITEIWLGVAGTFS